MSKSGGRYGEKNYGEEDGWVGRRQLDGRPSRRRRAGQRRETPARVRKNVAYAKRRDDGTFKEIDEVGTSLSRDRRTKAKTKTKKGYGDRGDRQLTT